MAQVEVISEIELGGGWKFETQILCDDGSLSKHVITLSWADYNLWSADGADQPAKVADAVISFLLSKTSSHDIPAKFDASLARRKFTDADAAIPALIGR